LAGISPSLNQQICDHVFRIMLKKNEVLNMYIVLNSVENNEHFITYMLSLIEIEFVSPEQVIIN
jgi:hypothetical protein